MCCTSAASALLLIVALLLKQSERLARYWQIASAAWFLQTLVGGSGNWLVRLLGLPAATPMGTAVYKVGKVMGTVAVILVLIKVAGMDLGSVYLKRGRLKWSLLGGGVLLSARYRLRCRADVRHFP